MVLECIEQLQNLEIASKYIIGVVMNRPNMVYDRTKSLDLVSHMHTIRSHIQFIIIASITNILRFFFFKEHHVIKCVFLKMGS